MNSKVQIFHSAIILDTLLPIGEKKDAVHNNRIIERISKKPFKTNTAGHDKEH